MKLQPMTDQEISRLNLIDAGQYQASIIESTEGPSRAGNDMFTLKLKVCVDTGKERTLTDWLMPSFPKKLKQACVACGLEDNYQAGEVQAKDFLFKNVIIDVVIAPDNKGEDVNRITGYSRKAMTVGQRASNEFVDSDLSDLPF